MGRSADTYATNPGRIGWGLLFDGIARLGTLVLSLVILVLSAEIA
jgi:hypothetical protein